MDRFKLIASSYLMLVKDNKILLSKRLNTGFADGFYSFPAGHLEPHETIKQCASREIFEEIGLRVKPKDLELVHIMHRKQDDERIDYFFIANKYSGKIINKEPHKCSDLRWFPLNKLPKNIVPYIRVSIRNYQKGILYSEFGWKHQ